MYLSDTTETLELVTTTTAALDVVASFIDHTSLGGAPDAQETKITTATTTTVIAAPAAATDRQVREVSIRNTSASETNQVTVQKDVSGTNYEIVKVTLQIGEALLYSEIAGGWRVLTSSGQVKEVSSEQQAVDGFPISFYKTGTAPEAAGQWYCYAKDAGFPGVWAPGTPGLDGRATDGLTAADAGCICPPDAGAGQFNYLTRFDTVQSVAGAAFLIDILWINSGLVVTTTTAQAIAAPVSLPARDLNGTTDGLGVQMGILVTTATTNAGAITNMTASYTNSNGNAGNTATVASYPATAVIGTLVPFRLAAGDVGVRSVQSVTLGTSLGAGAVSLVLYRILDISGNPLANAGQMTPGAAQNRGPGFKIYNRTCGILAGIASATTATNLQGLAGFALR